MGITIYQKSDLSKKKRNPKVGLVLAGGALSGAAFKIGGLKALNDFLVNKKLTDFDIYVGLSAGAILAVPLAGGIDPEEMLASLDGKSKIFSQFSPFDLYMPNFQEFVSRPVSYIYGHVTYLPGIAYDILSALPKLHKSGLFKNAWEFMKNPNYSTFEEVTKPLFKAAYSGRKVPTIGELFPSGFLNNRRIEKFLQRNMKNSKMPNKFSQLEKVTGKSLYMTAMNLDTSENVIFGPDEKNDLSISQAAQASSAIPGFYKPARIKGVDYIDGGVRKTANIDLAFEKGADLVICYNPFKPYNNKVFFEYFSQKRKHIAGDKRLADWGVWTVINQAFRTLFHSRLMYGLQTIVDDPKFKKDIILIEPKEDDADFFTLNPLYFWNRAKAASLGFESVTTSVLSHYDEIEKILNSYGIKMNKDSVTHEQEEIAKSHYDDETIMKVLENRSGSKTKKSKASKKLRVVK
jgi:NTE family protein